jgi:hypothetical protein
MVRVCDSNTESQTTAEGLQLRVSHTNCLPGVAGRGGVSELGERFLDKTRRGRYVLNPDPNPGKESFVTRPLIWSELRPPSPSDREL